MNTTEINGNRFDRHGMLKQKFVTSAGNELIYAEGKNKEGFEKLQAKLGKTKEEMHRIIAALYTSL